MCSGDGHSVNRKVLDFGLMAPLCVWTGVAAWRRQPMGHVLGAPFSVMAAGTLLATGSMLVSCDAGPTR